jgi:hypothetical protein
MVNFDLTGLGGTSLINANIFLRADEKTMGMKAWPPELREKGSLDECKCFLEFYTCIRDCSPSSRLR